MPTVIQPPEGLAPQPVDTTLIQIGFNKSLRYDFVVSHSDSIKQIFGFTPLGVANGLGINPNNITMHALQAFNTLSDAGYITTLALAYVPSNLVNKLSLDIRTASSDLYKNPDTSVNALMSMIDPTIPILAGPADGSMNGYGSGKGGAGTNAGNQGGSGNLGQQPDNGSSGSKPGTSVAIGVGVVAGAAVYGAAMFYVARRYKRRKQGHVRSSSLQQNSPEMSTDAQYQTLGNSTMTGGMNGQYSDRAESPDSMGSRNGTTHARQAGISRPIMAENSLGWR